MKKRQQLSAAALNTIHGTLLIRKDGTFDRSAIIHKARHEMRAQKIGWGEAQKYAWRVARGQMDKAREFDARKKPDIYSTVAARLFDVKPTGGSRRVGKMPELSMGYGGTHGLAG